MAPALTGHMVLLGATVFRKPPNVPAVDKPQLQCPEGKCQELWEDRKDVVPEGLREGF